MDKVVCVPVFVVVVLDTFRPSKSEVAVFMDELDAYRYADTMNGTVYDCEMEWK